MKKKFKKVPSERVFLKTVGKIITYGQMVKNINDFSSEYRMFRGKKVAVSFSDAYTACINLPGLIELTDSVFIEPNEIKDDVLFDFYNKSGIDYKLTFSGKDISIERFAELNDVDRKSSPGTAEIILTTSGTSGIPKLVSYSVRKISGAAKDNIDIGANFCWGLSYEMNRFAGLQVYFQAIAGGSAIVLGEKEAELEQTLNLFVKNKVNALSATPTFWRKLFMTESYKWLDLKLITLGGEIADQSILDALHKAYPKSKITHIYASTEAGVGFSVKDGKVGFPLSFLTEPPNKHVKLKIHEDLLWIRSTLRSELIISGNIEVDSDGYINTGDIVEIADNRVIFKGRESGSINVGGNKVIPEDVEQILLKHPGVSQCVVYGKKNPIMGTLVVADVVLTDGFKWSTNVKNELSEHCKLELELFKVPALFKVVSDISVNAAGKIARKVS